jgi:hypothetical protein
MEDLLRSKEPRNRGYITPELGLTRKVDFAADMLYNLNSIRSRAQSSSSVFTFGRRSEYQFSFIFLHISYLLKLKLPPKTRR